MPQGKKPRSEPEIIPPDHAERRTAQGRPQTRVFIDAHGTERVYVAKLGPLGIILAILTTGILSTVMLILLFGAFLIWDAFGRLLHRLRNHLWAPAGILSAGALTSSRGPFSAGQLASRPTPSGGTVQRWMPE
jgi:hypothetical protein